MTINQHDRAILRDLAKVQLEVANSDLNRERVELWKRHNDFRGERPIVHVETGTFADHVVTPRMRCEGDLARRIEYNLISAVINLVEFDDDWVVPDYYGVGHHAYFTLFGTRIERETAADASGGTLGHHFKHNIHDLEDDWAQIEKPSVYGVNDEGTREYKAFIEELLGDILPVRMVMGCLGASPTQEVVHRMGMETMFTSMYDYPELFKKMMDKIADDYIAYYKFLEQGGYLLPTTEFEWLGQGSMCFTSELPNTTPLTTRQVWGYMDSQETVGLSPAMFGEFIFPAYKRIADTFGLLSYGCCEPVDTFWEYVSQFDNLRKVSVSPWCNEDFIGEKLRGKRIMFHRKPSPNYLGVGDVLDEDAIRSHITTTLKAAKGCHLEITQRDVYAVSHSVAKVRHYVEIIRECIANEWA